MEEIVSDRQSQCDFDFDFDLYLGYLIMKTTVFWDYTGIDLMQ
jgi:hypothetical protein